MSQKHKKLVQQICGNTADDKLQHFVDVLYRDVPIESLESMPVTHLHKSAKTTFALLKKSHHNGWNVCIDNTTPDQEYAVLEIVSRELPFLVESIGNELKARGINIFLIVHPVLKISRNEKGAMTEISSDGAPEVVMQFHIANQFDRAFYDSLIVQIHEIIECVELAVKDWPKMKQLMEKSVADIYKDAAKKTEQAEIAEFFKWLIDGHFIFLGGIEAARNGDKFLAVKGTELGIMKSELHRREEFPCDYEQGSPMFIKKSDSRSVVHRSAHMNCIYYKSFRPDGSCDYATIFVGFFTSNVYYESVRAIPFIRQKVDRILERYGFPASSYNAKELVTALEAFSRTELVQMSENDLYETATSIVSLSLMPRVKLFIRPDRINKFINCLIFIPQSRFAPGVKEVIERILCQQLNGTMSQYYMHVEENQLTRLQIIIKTLDATKREFNVAKIESLIVDAISVWNDDLLKALKIKHKTHDAMILFNKFQDAFDIKYTSSFAAKQAVHDIKMVEAALREDCVQFDFYLSAKSGKDLLQLKICSPNTELPLSSVLPVIENFGFFVIDTLTFAVKVNDSGKKKDVFIHHFRLKLLQTGAKGLTDFGKDNVEKALESLWKGEVENDKFNALILQVGINCREALVLRAYAKYFKQICFPYAAGAIVNALLANADITSKLVALFNLKFDIKNKSSSKAIKTAAEEVTHLLSAVPNVVEDKILRSYLEVILATKRTNFFQKTSTGEIKKYLSCKIASSEIEDMPLPRPFMEIFVYSTKFEAIHLRGSKVARGGLRWSDRHEDFRTEVLGLMKAQMTKNSVIVPGGSKGGFVIKSVKPSAGRDIFLQEGIACYKEFLSGVLDLTDNIVENKIVPPQDVVRHDVDDYYLVVAADKGTATFSDYANEISKKYNFWLGDAFASGGSVGYDHKKMAITAKGAWISAEDHLRNLGIDINNQPFTAVGIGDMSGDVFGNGLLLSKHYRLIAAFNHMHIFLDPNPDSAKSFAERQRLFDLPRSQWSDYNLKIISQGGGIFNRSEKTIAITTEVQKALDITDKQLSPDELIKAILKAPVDLLWNGGIGTYVKAKYEAHSAIGDKTNDDLRVNGKELRCKAVAEGGNLGFTQPGRIEFARNNGKINTDFIDNSAGVDCSDHEVNMKIAFSDMLSRKKIASLEVRNKLLMEMTEEVGQLVLRDNMQQSLLLTLEEHRNKERVDEHAWLMRYLEHRGELDREVEKLPSNEEMSRVIAEYGKLSRPEIAVLIAYAKNSAKRMLSNEGGIMNDPYIQNYLIRYFPKTMQKPFAEDLVQHKLKDEIAITVLVNSFVNILGCYLFHFLIDGAGCKPTHIIKAFIIASEALGIMKLWHKIEALPSSVPAALRMKIFLFIQRLLKRNVLWLLTNYSELSDVGALMQKFQRGVENILQLKKSAKQLVSQFECFEGCADAARDGLLPKDILQALQDCNSLHYAFDIIKISQEAGSTISEAASIYHLIAKELSIDWLLGYAPTVSLSGYIESAALQSIIIDIGELHMTLAISELKNKRNSLEHSEQLSHYKEFVSEIKKSSLTMNFIPTLTIAVKRFKDFVKIYAN